MAIDAGLALVCLIFAYVDLWFGFEDGSIFPDDGPAPTEASLDLWWFVVAAVGCLALLGRRRAALAVLIITVVMRLILYLDTGQELTLVGATTVALYTMARSGERRRSLAISVAVGTAMAFAVAVAEPDPLIQEFIGEWVISMLPVALADAARSRADRLELLIDGEADRRVQAERLRIARDLHDVVAHGLSTIAVQSGVAEHLLDQNPEQAREALQIINTTGRKSLDELRSMVGVLRSTDAAPLLPIPTDPNDLAAIIGGATNAGVVVTTEVEGAFPSTVSESCIVAAHRIIQEALTNVARHAGEAPTVVRVDHGEDRVILTVTNQPGRSSGARAGTANAGSTGGSRVTSGVGIVGMTERAESLGGTLAAGPTADGGFTVTAVLPYSIRQT